MNARPLLLTFALALLAFAGFAAAAQAAPRILDHGGVYVGDVYVDGGQIVRGDVTVIGGNATIDGAIDGDLTVVGGDIDERPGSTITGKINNIGGNVTRGIVPFGGASVTSYFLDDWRVISKIAWSAVVLLFFLIFPVRTRMALDRLEKHPGLAAAIGLAGWVAVIPLAVLLICTVLLIPLVFVEGIALVAGIFIGKAALSLLVGRRLYEAFNPRSTPTPLMALIFGLALITAAELVPILGGLVSALVGLVGLGATILAFVREQSFAGPPVAAPAGPPIGGPPMTVG